MIVLLILTRDQADLLRHNLAHHLEWDVDHVVVVDNGSADHTQGVVREFGRSVTASVYDGDVDGRLPALVEAFHRVERHHGPVEWAGVSDTDEFWWSPDSSLGSILGQVPGDALGVNFEQKLFLPTELDRPEGPVYCRRIFRSSGSQSPLHTSYREGKSFYRGEWVRKHGVSHGHWSPEIPHPPHRHELSLVHHYMVEDEDGFVQKVRTLESLRPQIRDHNVPPRLGAFKVAWWRLYEEQGEEGLREYYRTRYVIRAEELERHLEAGELLRDTAFADLKLEQMQ